MAAGQPEVHVGQIRPEAGNNRSQKSLDFIVWYENNGGYVDIDGGKIDPVRIRVIKEYLEGASASDISIKYGTDLQTAGLSSKVSSLYKRFLKDIRAIYASVDTPQLPLEFTDPYKTCALVDTTHKVQSSSLPSQDNTSNLHTDTVADEIAMGEDLWEVEDDIVPEDENDQQNTQSKPNHRRKGQDIYITSEGDETARRANLNDHDGLTAYLREIGRIEMLSHTQEIELAKRREAGDPEAVQQFIVANLRLVVSIARRHVGRGLSLDDLIQEGNIGLMRAVQRYDWRRGNRFSTHATWWIRQAISKAVLDKGRTVRLPTGEHTTLRRIQRERQRLIQELGRNPKEQELADALDMKVERIREIEAAPNILDSLEEMISEEDDRTLGDTIPDTKASTEEEAIAAVYKERIKQAVQGVTNDVLNPRERLILQMRFLNGDVKAIPLETIGRQLGITRERVRQIEQEALIKLRHPKVIEQLAPYLD